MNKLSDDKVSEKLKTLDGWTLEDESIQKEYELKNFTEALGFVTKVGVTAEKAAHHPDVLLHSWNKVKITVSTHDAGGITDKDFDLAGKIDEL